MKSPTFSNHSNTSSSATNSSVDTVVPFTTTATKVQNTFPRWYQIVIVYLSSAWTGQLWFFAVEVNTVVGCATWGTIGTLCMIGMIRPMYRFESFVMAASFVILSQIVRPYSSVYGTTMSALFGWSIASGGYYVGGKQPGIIYAGNHNDFRGMKSTTFMGTVCMVLLVSLPVLFLAFKKKQPNDQ